MDTTIHWLRTAFDGLVAFFPSLVAGLVILLVGYIVAKVLGGITRSLAHRFHFERLVARLGVGTSEDQVRSPYWLGKIVYLVVMLATLIQASRAWRLDFVASGLSKVVAYLPHVLGAAFILGLALLAGNWLRERLVRVRTERTSFGPMTLLPGIARTLVIAVGGFMALRELQIAPEIVNAAFIIILGAAGVAGAIAFGLGGRDVAGKIASSWYDRRDGLKSAARSVTASAEE